MFNLKASTVASASAPATTALKTEGYFSPNWKDKAGNVVDQPIVTLKRGFTNMSFGLNKAVMILEAAALIQEFVAQNQDKLKASEATYLQRVADGTYANLKAQGKIKDRVISGQRVI